MCVQVETRRNALFAALLHRLETRRSAVASLGKRIRDPKRDVILQRDNVRAMANRLRAAFQRRTELARGRFQELTTALGSLSPLAVLGRGYSLTRTIPEGRLITQAQNLSPGDLLRLTFAQGEAVVRVEETQEGN